MCFRLSLHHGLVQCRLLSSEAAEDFHFVLLGQVPDDARIGLQAPEHERLHQTVELVGRFRIPVSFDGNTEVSFEGRLRAQIARVQELHDRPQLAQAVLDRCPGQRDTDGRTQRRRACVCLADGILDVLRFVQHQSSPIDRAEMFQIAMNQDCRWRRPCRAAPLREQRLAPVPTQHRGGSSTRRDGAKRSASFLQLLTTEVGQISKNGLSSASSSFRCRSRANT